MSHPTDLLQNLAHLSAAQLRQLLTEHLTKQKLGLYWKSSAIERDAALNATGPETVRQHLQQAWEGTEKTVESISLQKALLYGQIAPRRKRQPKTQNEPQAL